MACVRSSPQRASPNLPGETRTYVRLLWLLERRPSHGAEIYMRPHRMFITFPTNEKLACICVVWPPSQFHAFRADIARNFLQTLDLAPQFAERVRQGKQEGRFMGTADVPNFFRKPYGPGWALVGDAGYHKDPYAGTGHHGCLP